MYTLQTYSLHTIYKLINISVENLTEYKCINHNQLKFTSSNGLHREKPI